MRWAGLSPARRKEQAGLRPVAIINQDVFNQRSGTVIVMAITNQSQPVGTFYEVHVLSEFLPVCFDDRVEMAL